MSTTATNRPTQAHTTPSSLLLGPTSVGTVSKSLAPVLRRGYIVCPPRLAEVVAEQKGSDDRGSPVLDQLVRARVIESGRFDKHLRRMRAIYAARRQTLVDALIRHAPDVELTGLAGGFHAVARLLRTIDEQAVVSAAAERSIQLHPMSWYRADGATQPPELVLGFGNLTEGEIERGIAAIADLLRS